MFHLSDLGSTPFSAKKIDVSSTFSRAEPSLLTPRPPTSLKVLVAVPFEVPVLAYFLLVTLPAPSPPHNADAASLRRE